MKLRTLTCNCCQHNVRRFGTYGWRCVQDQCRVPHPMIGCVLIPPTPPSDPITVIPPTRG